MKWSVYIFSLTWRLWFFILFALLFFLFLIPLFFFTSIYKNKRAVCNIASIWSKLTLYGSFIFPRIEIEEELDINENYIFCPNHVSTLDIPFILSIIPNPLQFIGKAEISQIPLFGYFFKENSVIVDRKNKINSYSAFLKAAKILNSGLSMCIFPEGGIPQPEIVLKKFKNGPFKLAIEQDIKIVPITILDNKRLFPQQYFKGRPGFSRVIIHKPIDPNSIPEKSIDNFNSSVYNIIFKELKDYESR